VLLVCGLGLGSAADAILTEQNVAPGGVNLLTVLMIGGPFALALLTALAHAARVERRMLHVKTCDLVTGLPNRGHFLARAGRALPQSGVLLLLDIDHFKRLNDAHGHRAGDLCLMALAQRFRELTRSTDILGRLDGAVFAIYLPGAPIETARDIGGRMSEGLEVVAGDRILRVTISVGAVVSDGCTPLDHLMREADKALDRAKLQGRARMIVEEMAEAA
jgi:diguanylate cyclase (GGDEF)-like protein